MTTPRTPVLALAGLTLAAALTGCAADATAADGTTAAGGPAGAGAAGAQGDASGAVGSSASPTSRVVDGTYAGVGIYTSPAGKESIEVTLTVDEGIVAAIDVVPQATNPTSQTFQSDFASAISAQVVGIPLEDVDVDVVAGASLTTQGFESALAAVLADARA
ncbi:FMN-binding protein [Cellulomonas fimi]|uniref:FMN-binding protein n=1 Tax=Cellulomonas fimi TaxID=1708 RepID=UPI00234D045D|nr:FMN-binding protein [Cellulomonas fimi]MDC7122333.1 FMN-binding protein [Cellulomonas fimi]